MAGLENRTGPDLDPSSVTSEQNATRLSRDDSNPYTGGQKTYGSGAAGGPGLGNKTAPQPEGLEANDFKPVTQSNSEGDTGRRHGSYPVGAAGYGNKTGGFGEIHDSRMGKFMQNLGHVLHYNNLEVKGKEMRAEKGWGRRGSN